MGQSQSEINSSFRLALHSRRYDSVNILIIGDIAQGKSSLISTLYYAATDHRVTLVAESAPAGQHRPTTVRYRSFSLESHLGSTGIKVYDTPGMNFSTPNELLILRKILDGVPPGSVLRGQSEADRQAILERLEVDQSHKIDFVIVVVGSTDIEVNKQKGFMKDTASIHIDTTYYKNLFNCIQEHSKHAFAPFIVFTKKDLTVLSDQQLKIEAFPWVHESNKFIITNYTSVKAEDVQTDKVALEILLAVCTRKSTAGFND